MELLTATISPVERLHSVFPDGGEVVGDIGCRFAGVVWGELGFAGIALCEARGLGCEYLGWVEKTWSVSRGFHATGGGGRVTGCEETHSLNH